MPKVLTHSSKAADKERRQAPRNGNGNGNARFHLPFDGKDLDGLLNELGQLRQQKTPTRIAMRRLRPQIARLLKDGSVTWKEIHALLRSRAQAKGMTTFPSLKALQNAYYRANAELNR